MTRLSEQIAAVGWPPQLLSESILVCPPGTPYEVFVDDWLPEHGHRADDRYFTWVVASGLFARMGFEMFRTLGGKSRAAEILLAGWAEMPFIGMPDEGERSFYRHCGIQTSDWRMSLSMYGRVCQAFHLPILLVEVAPRGDRPPQWSPPPATMAAEMLSALTRWKMNFGDAFPREFLSGAGLEVWRRVADRYLPRRYLFRFRLDIPNEGRSRPANLDDENGWTYFPVR